MKATLTDFGLSRVMSGTTIIGTRTMTAGTPGYQAPEQLKAESIGVHSDVYAFGCDIITLYQEKVLWPGLTPYQILCKVTIGKEKPDISSLSSDISSLVDKCLMCFPNRPTSKEVLASLLGMVGTFPNF